MIGWLLAPLAAFSGADWLLRLPATLLPALVALGVGWSLAGLFGRDRETAGLAALAVLLVPMNVWNVLITTDTPLVLFSVASAVAFARAAERAAPAWFVAAGVLLGLAFLSKYFAVLLGLGYLAWAIASPGAPRRWSGPALTVAGALPFGLLNLYWNWQSCWSNVMFNAIVRHQADGGWSLVTPALYVASLAYLAAPLLWFAWRGRARLADAWRRDGERALLLAWAVPLAVFALLSPVKRIGLHWLLSFVPLMVLSVALALGRRELAASGRFYAVLALAHAVAIGTLAALPLETWKSAKLYRGLVFLTRTDDVLAALAPELKQFRLAADSYSAAAVLSHHGGLHVPVFGGGSSHARHDDILTDWRGYAGTDLLVLRREPPLVADYAPYFRAIGFGTLTLYGATFHVVRGRGFDYEAYRSKVLASVGERYYRIPAWLPVGRCYFHERYAAP